jgi:hypothetical protein
MSDTDSFCTLCLAGDHRRHDDSGRCAFTGSLTGKRCACGLPEEATPTIPEACEIEIVEKLKPGQPPPAHGVIVPNEIRINGSPVLAPADEEVIVHEIKTKPGDVIKVTLTLFAKRVTISAEEAGE